MYLDTVQWRSETVDGTNGRSRKEPRLQYYIIIDLVDLPVGIDLDLRNFSFDSCTSLDSEIVFSYAMLLCESSIPPTI